MEQKLPASKYPIRPRNDGGPRLNYERRFAGYDCIDDIPIVPEGMGISVFNSDLAGPLSSEAAVASGPVLSAEKPDANYLTLLAAGESNADIFRHIMMHVLSTARCMIVLHAQSVLESFAEPSEHLLRYPWNEAFQSLYEQPVFTPHEIAQANQKKRSLIQVFLHWSAIVAEKLVQQLSLPQAEWKIQPLQQQLGVAGGQKFMVGQLFCKFAHDDKKIYGSDELAIKMAANEIRNANAVLHLGISYLHFSLSACHRIRGHAVITTALIPINPRNTLVYGSNDGGKTIVRGNATIIDLVDRVAGQLGLLPHVVRGHQADMKVSVGADCEGHVSAEDGRLYLLDLGRLLPPNDAAHPYTLVWQFRPEYMKWRVQHGLLALSSDAFTNFGIPRDDGAVYDAIRHYFDEYLPMVVQHLLSRAEEWREPVLSKKLVRLLHERGINLRHLGRVFLLVSAARTHRAAELRLVLLQEMTRRSLKNVLFHRMRSSGSDSFDGVGASGVLAMFARKYPEVNLTAHDQDYITDTLLDEASPLSVWPEVRQIVTNTVSDVVIAPDFPTVEEAEQRLLGELELRQRTVGVTCTCLLGTMRLLLHLYTVWHSDSPGDTQRKAAALVARMVIIADADVNGTECSSVYTLCGHFWSGIGQYDKALPLYERSVRLGEALLGDRHPTVLSRISNLATAYQNLAQYDTAKRLFERVRTVREQIFGERHADVASSLHKLARLYCQQGLQSGAEPLFKQALHLREELLGERHPDVAATLNDLAALYVDRGLYEQAKPLCKRALQLRLEVLGAKHADVAASLSCLGNLYASSGDFDSAEPLFEQALNIREQVLGERHPDVASSLNDLADLCRTRGQPVRAKPLCTRALELREQTLGRCHPEVATSLHTLAGVLGDQSSYEQAQGLCIRALRIRQDVFGERHPLVGASLNHMGVLCREQGRYVEAVEYTERALRIREETLGELHPDLAASLNNLANLHMMQGRYDRATPLYERTLRLLENLLGDRHPDVAVALNNLANVCSEQGDYINAEPLYERALRLREEILGDQHPEVATSLNNLAGLYRSEGRFVQAESFYIRALQLREVAFGERHPHVADSLNSLAILYKMQGSYDKALPLYTRALRIREEVLGSNHPDTGIACNNLGTLCMEQGRFEEAEALLNRALSVFTGMLSADHPYSIKVRETLRELHSKLEHPTDGDQA